MFSKGNKLYSIFKSKCPQCHEGAFFKHKFSYNVLKTTEAREHCPNCNIKYMREPSFFYGAMYVGYGISVALAVAFYIISAVFFGLSMRESLVVLAVGLFVLAPWSLRLSRVVWIHIFIKYQKDKEKWVK